MKKIKGSIAGLLVVALLVSFWYQPLNIYGEEAGDHVEDADYLNGLGLFNGGSNGYDLMSAPDRQQGAVMVVRLLGKEAEALAYNYSHPFTDVASWASPHVGYLYANGITNGQSDTSYGANDPLTDDMYMTFLLRILGYTTPDDFAWNESIEKAFVVGVMNDLDFGDYAGDDNPFLRDDMVLFSTLLLKASYKDQASTVYDQLVLDGVIPEPTPQATATPEVSPSPEVTPQPTVSPSPNETPDSEETPDPEDTPKPEETPEPGETPEVSPGPTPEVTPEPTATPSPEVTPQPSPDFSKGYITSQDLVYPYDGMALNVTPVNDAEFVTAIEVAVYNWVQSFSIDISNVNTNQLQMLVEQALDNISKQPGFFSSVTGYKYVSSGSLLNIDINYSLSEATYQASLDEADRVIAAIIQPGMTDYEKEKAIHDYLVDNTVYDLDYANSGNTPFCMYGNLILGRAVCQGYAEAFDYLCALAGIECYIVVGNANDGGQVIPHAWNLVKIEDLYYHVDPTFDDPTMADGSNVRNYYYFNVTDDFISVDHTWVRSDYPVAYAEYANYYYINGWMVANEEDLRRIISIGFDERRSLVSLRYGSFDLTNGALERILQDVNNGRFSSVSYFVDNQLKIVEVSNIAYK